ncbi:amidohydrolase, partial [Achromobacter sp. SIMBA_011]
IPQLSSVLTVVDGKVVHADAEFASLAPPLPPVSPAWSPVADRGADGGADDAAGGARARARASAAAGACAEPGMDACRTRGHGRRFARS